MVEKKIIPDSMRDSISESIELQFDDLFAPEKPDEISHKKVVSKKESSDLIRPSVKTTPKKVSPQKTVRNKRSKPDHTIDDELAVSEMIPVINEKESVKKDAGEQPIVQNVFKKANQEIKKNRSREGIIQCINYIIFALLVMLIVLLSVFVGITMSPGKITEFLNVNKSSDYISKPVNHTVVKKENTPKIKKISSFEKPAEVLKPDKSEIQRSDIDKEKVESQARSETALSLKSDDTNPLNIGIEKKASYPYSVYLGSYSSIEKVTKASSEYFENGLSSYWIRLDLGKKGVWFRLFTGYFKEREDADRFIKDRKLKDAESRLTKYANLFGVYKSKEDADKRMIYLEKLGYCPYIISDTDDIYYIFTGAFYQKNRAEELKKNLELKGIKSEVVER